MTPVASAPADPAPVRRSIRVVMDNNYPPYVFQPANGALQGIAIDRWRLWEKKTGISVQIDAMDWDEALRRMRAGEFDVIDTIFETPERRAYFDFTAPYARIEVPIFFRKDISGIADLESLRGFPVAAKTGDHAEEVLRDHGGVTVLPFPNYPAIVEAARQHRINVFVIDAPPALYFLNKLGLADEFRRSAPINVGEFHCAVRKGETALLRTIETGFAALTPAELKQIDEKWFGVSLGNGPYLTYVGYIAGAACLIIIALIGWNRALRRMVGARTAALRTSEVRYRALVETSFDWIWEVDTQARYTFASPRVRDLLGFEAPEVLGRTPFDFMPEAEARRVQVVFQRIAEARQPFAALENTNRHKDGRLVVVETSGVPILAPDGTWLGYRGMDRDITERKQADAALRTSEERYRTLFTSMTEGFVLGEIICEPPGRPVDWRTLESNLAMEKLTGVATPDRLAKTALEIAPNMDPFWIEVFGKVALTGEPTSFERFGSITKRYWNMVVFSPARGRFGALYHDITERKRAEEELRASLREKNALLKEVHHRVKNNLQVITSLLRLEAGRHAEAGTKAVLKEMQGRILSMALLHETFYRSGNFSEVDLAGYLKQLASQLIRAHCVEPGTVRLRLELASAQVTMDQAIPCGLIVNELVTNCLKHAFPDGRGGEVAIGLQPEPDGRLRIQVSDTGPGLPENFEIADSTTLGLHLVADLARQLGGTLEIGRGPGGKFTVFFPLASAVPPPK